MLGVIEFVCWTAIVSLSAAFVLGLAVKWHVLEWLQIHAPNALFEQMLNCKFCCSWWVSVLISLTLCVATGNGYLLAIPFCSTIITRELW